MKSVFILLLFSSTLFSQIANIKVTKKGNEGTEHNNSYTEKAKSTGSFFTNISNQPDNIMSGNISTIQLDGVKCFTTVTEETEPNKGRIWAIYGSNNHATPDSLDTIYLYFSDDNGVTWNAKVGGSLSPGRMLYPGMIDAVIVANPTDPNSHKFLYVVYTYATGDYLTGLKKSALLCTDITGTTGGQITLDFPGGANNHEYDVRIATDNQQFPSEPWVYMVCTIDSVLNNGTTICMQRIARIEHPFTYLNDYEITYRNDILQKYLTLSNVAVAVGKSDIVFVKGTSQLVYYSLSHKDADGIYINSTSITGFDVNVPIYHIDVGVSITDHKMASAYDVGANKAQIMLVATRFLSNNSKDLVSYKLNMNNNASSEYTYIIGASSGDVPRFPDVVAPQNTIDDFRLSFAMNFYGNPDYADSVLFTESVKTSGNAWTPLHRVSLGTGGSNSHSKYSKVGVKLNSADNVFVLWSNSTTKHGYYGQNFLCTYNADSPTGVETEKTIPADFSLSQNYPNPFNPSTKISWQSPVGSHQTLMIYDVLGNEVATLVNEYKPAGSYEVNFDASKLSSGVYIYKIQAGDFVNSKKMLLLK